jgi:hypothetical protein
VTMRSIEKRGMDKGGESVFARRVIHAGDYGSGASGCRLQWSIDRSGTAPHPHCPTHRHLQQAPRNELALRTRLAPPMSRCRGSAQ